MSVTGKMTVRRGITSCKAFILDTDTVAATASSAVPGTNDPTWYTITFASLAQGFYRLVFYIGSREAGVEPRAWVGSTIIVDPLPDPVSPGLCTVRVPVVDMHGQILVGARVTVELDDINSTVDSALVARVDYSGLTGASGYVDLTLIQFTSFTSGGVYSLKVSDPNGKPLFKKRVKVPTVSSCYADDLLDP